MRAETVAVALLASGLVSCSECKAPEGCLRAGDVQGVCQCLEWQVVSVENVPVRFVVINAVYRLPGNQSVVSYGYGDGPPPADAEIGSRWRSVVRAYDGSERVAAIGRFDTGGGLLAQQVTPASEAVRVHGGGPESGSTGVFSFFYDVASKARDWILIWVNPVAIVSTDYAGNRKVEWSWSANCYSPFECLGAQALALTPAELDGTTPPYNPYARPFVDALTAAERAAILRYHPLYDPPERDPATIASDARFLFLGTAALAPGGASYPSPAWTPCDGTLSDAEFPVLAQMEVPFGWGSGTLLVQHSVYSISAACETQWPGMVLGTSTPGCAITADLYLDTAFGTVFPVLVSATPECTTR